MKYHWLKLVIPCAVLLTGCSEHSNKPAKKEEKKETTEGELNKKDVSYALGYNVGEVLRKTDEELSIDEVTKGLKDAFKNSSPRMDEGEIKKLLTLYNMEVAKKMRDKQEITRQENLKKGKEFIEDYAKKPGVKKDESGFYYRVIKQGDGQIPKAEDVVMVDYTGKKLDGKPFFSTKDNGQPAQFTVANVIKGWNLVLQKMPEGSTWEVVIPPDLAYGDRGVGDAIGPGETLLFEINLREIKDKQYPDDKVELE